MSYTPSSIQELFDVKGLVAVVTGGGTGSLSDISCFQELLIVVYRYWSHDSYCLRAQWGNSLHCIQAS